MDERYKRLMPIPRYNEIVPWGNTKTWDLIKKGIIRTRRIGGRSYVDMDSHCELVGEQPE
jgi:hypothetical protein